MMGKIQYRVLVISFICFVAAMVALSVSVHVTLGELVRGEVKSSLEAARTYKLQYLKSWVGAERESLDAVYVGPELVTELYEFVNTVPESNERYIDRLNAVRKALVEKLNRDTRAELSIVVPGGDVYVSSNLELLQKPHPFWFSNQYARRSVADSETRVFVSLGETLELILVRNLYFEGNLYAYMVLRKPIPQQFLFEFAHDRASSFEVLLYNEDQAAFLFGSQDMASQKLTLSVPVSDVKKSAYWLEPKGWMPIDATNMVGTWGWDNELDLGVAVIAPSKRVFNILRIAQNINIGFVFCILTASLIIAWFFKEYRKHRLYLEHQLEHAIEVQARDLSNERREKENLVEALFQNSSDGYLVVTPSEVLECNPASLSMLELDGAGNLVGRAPFQYSPPFQADGAVSLEKADELIRQAFDTGFIRFEWQFETKSRTRLYCWVTITIVKYYGAQVGIMVWQNMTKTIESEKILRDSERKNRAILNATNHVLFVLDQQGFIVDLNSTAAEWLGEGRNQLLGLSYWDVSGWLVDEELMRLIRNAFDEASQGHVARFEADLKLKDSTHYFDFVLTPIHDESHALVMVIMEAYDISQIRRAELAEKEARQMAEEVSQTKTNFLANMSHEIRTPMNAIMGLTKLCLKTDLNDRQRTMLESIDQASETLLNILNDILDFSKVESGKLEIELVTFAIEDVLQTVAGLFSLKAEEKQLAFKVSNETKRMNLIGDPLRIQQILMNLCSNAIKFTQQGEVSLSVVMLEQKHDRGLFRFSVSDSGVGLSQSQQEKLFEAFSQADSSTTRQFGGTGLGLAICKELVELMGGTIQVESEQGKGSCFYFDLPLALLDDADDPFENSFASKAETIAIVDDNVVCIEVENKIVKKLGYRAKVFDSANELFAALEQDDEKIDVILMDWDMPGIDGCEASLKIKSQFGAAAPAIVLVTGIQNEIPPEQFKQYGLDGFVIKPVNPDVLAHVINGVIAKGERNLLPATGVDSTDTETLPPVKILVVEDNDINQMVVSNFLKETGLVPIVVNNGKEAVDYLTANPDEVNAVLMDLQMPVMDGFMATRKLREQFDAERLPIIAMTANVMASDREQAKSLGMNDIVAKPIDFETFEWVLAQWVDVPKSFVKQPASDAPSLNHLACEGLDFDFGLRQVGNDQALYFSLLQKFKEEFTAALLKMEQASSNHDQKALAALSHKMKGVAGNLGFDDLREQLKYIEEGAECNRDVSDGLLAVSGLWPKFCSAVDSVLPILGAGDEPAVDVMPVEALVDYLNDVANRLNSHEVLPMDEVRRLKQCLLPHFSQASVERFCRCVESFEMDEALEFLVSFVEQLLRQEKN